MAEVAPTMVTAATEGVVAEAVVRRLIREVGAQPGPIHGKSGKQHLRQRIVGYNNAAQFSPWIVLVDLNGDAECALPLRRDWLKNSAKFMCFRIAVREVEAWLLADRATLANFLGVAVARMPQDVELLGDPKQELVNLARHSRRREIREDMVPRPGSGRAVGPAYASRLIEFVDNFWVPKTAAKYSDSLRRAINRLQELVVEHSRFG
jgi:hypothetical protein